VKYDDPQAERAHRRAQQRDPSDVVELGAEIQLVLQEVDYSGQQTIMGSKNGLVIFVNEAPPGLSKHDCIQVKIIDYGGNNNSAQAAFVGYNE
jgi:predicted RNA-binding protein with TRAM domain